MKESVFVDARLSNIPGIPCRKVQHWKLQNKKLHALWNRVWLTHTHTHDSLTKDKMGWTINHIILNHQTRIKQFMWHFVMKPLGAFFSCNNSSAYRCFTPGLANMFFYLWFGLTSLLAHALTKFVNFQTQCRLSQKRPRPKERLRFWFWKLQLPESVSGAVYDTQDSCSTIPLQSWILTETGHTRDNLHGNLQSIFSPPKKAFSKP